MRGGKERNKKDSDKLFVDSFLFLFRHKTRDLRKGLMYEDFSLVEFGNPPLCGDLCDSEFNGPTGRDKVPSVEFRNVPDLYGLRDREYRNAPRSVAVDPQGDSWFLRGKETKERNRLFAW